MNYSVHSYYNQCLYKEITGNSLVTVPGFLLKKESPSSTQRTGYRWGRKTSRAGITLGRRGFREDQPYRKRGTHDSPFCELARSSLEGESPETGSLATPFNLALEHSHPGSCTSRFLYARSDWWDCSQEKQTIFVR